MPIIAGQHQIATAEALPAERTAPSLIESWPDPSGCCDRCDQPFAASVYRLDRTYQDGRASSWFICALCVVEFAKWLDAPSMFLSSGGTK